MADLVDAAAELTAAQEAAMAGNDAGALKAALPRMREQTGRVATLAAGIAAREGQTGSGSSSADIGVRLGVLAGGTAAMALLRRGLLGVEDPGLVDPFAGFGSVATQRSRRQGHGHGLEGVAEQERWGEAPGGVPSRRHRQGRRRAGGAQGGGRRRPRAGRRRDGARRGRAFGHQARGGGGRGTRGRPGSTGAARRANADLEEALAELSSAEQRRDEAGRRLAALEP